LWYVPYLLLILLTVTNPTRRTVAEGVVAAYGIGLLGAWVPRLFAGGDITVATLALPLETVVAYLAVATAVWLAYHGGRERLTDAAELVSRHPLFVFLGEEGSNRAVPLLRGLFAVVPAAVVGAGGLVVTGVLYDVLRAAATSGSDASGFNT
jgi:hypothetical protein